MTFDHLGRERLAALVPEWLLCGHLIDRAAMPHVLAAWGREGMGQVAIEEWSSASPVYSRRMRAVLGLEGAGVTDIVKCLQHDIGAPPQFMDFRFTVKDEEYGEFALAHCGALMDVEPMGTDYVVTMCHDIEDPTFDATAVATNPRAQVRPIHRPPRTPADRHPHCAWTITIDEAREPLALPGGAVALGDSQAARMPVSSDPGTPHSTNGNRWSSSRGERAAYRDHYRGALQADVDWAGYSRTLLLRLADEISLQWHLLALGFARAVASRTTPDEARDLQRKQLVGIAGLTSHRLRSALGLDPTLEAVADVLAVHPVLNPHSYTGVRTDGDRIFLDLGAPAYQDPGWLPLLTHPDLRPLEAMVRGVCPTAGVVVELATAREQVLRVVETGAAADELSEVALTRFSTGADFVFQPRGRGLLPLL